MSSLPGLARTPLSTPAASALLALVVAGTFAFVLDGGGAGPVAGGGAAAGAPADALATRAASPAQADRARAAFAGLPLRFEANRGQTDPRVRFLSRGPGYALFLTPREAVIKLERPTADDPALGPSRASASQSAVVRMRLSGADPAPAMSAAEPLRAKSTYLVGGQRPAVASNHREVTYHRPYPGIDLVFHGRRGALEYDFNVAAGADPSRIALDFQGAERLRIDARGDLVIQTAAGPLRQSKPVVYQRIGDRQRAVSGRYELRGARRVGFRLGRYDRTRSLVIDPTITYSTYLGGTGGDRAMAVAVDAAGNAYVTGSTTSDDFPTTAGAFQPTRPLPNEPLLAGAPDAFVAKIATNASGAASLAYSTYLGGRSDTTGFGIAVDVAGAAYVTGETAATDFPTAGPIPGSSCGATTGPFTFLDLAFVTKLSATGGLVYSTCLPGTRSFRSRGHDIAVDGSGNAHVVGRTGSTTLPVTTGAYQPTIAGGDDAFMVRLNAAGSAMTYATYLGGAGTDIGKAVALDSSGNAYIAGDAAAGFPTTAGAVQPAHGGSTDAFVAKISPAGGGASDLVYSTYLGGAGADTAADIAVRSGESYVAGQTLSTNFPTQNPLGSALGGTADGFVTKLNAAGSALAYSTYLGGGGNFEAANGIAVDAAGRAYVAGAATPGFPTAGALPDRQCGPRGSAFVARLVPAGSEFDYSTCLEGPGASLGVFTQARAIAVDGAQNAYTVGFADRSDELPAVNAFQEDPRAEQGSFVAKLAASPPAVPSVHASSPAGGPASGATRVVIAGRQLGGATGVSFGGTPASSFTVESATRITAVSPPHSAGPTFVTVTNGAGSSPDDTRARFFYGEGGWQRTEGLPGGHVDGHTATVLPSGSVLVAGGSRLDSVFATSRADLYDPKTGEWGPTGGMGTPRKGHTATLLPDGKVLVAGGEAPAGRVASAELYDPGTGQWTAANDSMDTARASHTATLIGGSDCGANCGKVLIAGGGPFSLNVPTATAELYTPATGQFAPTGSMQRARTGHEAMQVTGSAAICGARCGRVMVIAGIDTVAGDVSAELYDPLTGTWGPTGAMGIGERFGVGAATMANGRVLATGGGCFGLPRGTSSAESYDPAADAWSPTANLMSTTRSAPAVASLPSGKTLVAGGSTSCGESARTPTAEVLDPADNRWRPAGAMHARRGGLANITATVLSGSTSGFAADPARCGANCGKVLIVGGTPLDFAELYVPEPGVSGAGPGDGSTAGGTSVTVTGQGFTHGVRQVLFGSTPAASFTVDGYGQLRAVAPAHAAGTVDITVVNDGGRATRANAFTYAAPPPGDPPPVLDPLAPPGPGPVPGPGTGPGPDGVRPVVSAVSVLDREFSIGSLLPLLARSSRVGTRIRFRLSEPATARLSFARARSGRRVGSSCRAPSARLRSRRACTRYVAVSPAVVIRGARQGLNSVRFQGRLSPTRRLAPGRYRVTVTATDAAGNRSSPKSAQFALLRARRT